MTEMYRLDKRQIRKLNEIKGCNLNPDYPESVTMVVDTKEVTARIYVDCCYALTITMAEAFKL